MTTPLKSGFSTGGVYIRVADALVAAGGLIMFFFSFAPFVSVPSVEVLGTKVAGGSQNAWNFLTPVVLFVVFAAILLVATAFLDTFWHRGKQIVGVNRHHVQVGLALYALVTLIAFALTNKGGESFGWGGIFMLIGSLVAAAGAILNHFGMMQNQLGAPSGSAPQTYYAPPPQATSPTDIPTTTDPTV